MGTELSLTRQEGPVGRKRFQGEGVTPQETGNCFLQAAELLIIWYLGLRIYTIKYPLETQREQEVDM